jgi:hypothetical protein
MRGQEPGERQEPGGAKKPAGGPTDKNRRRHERGAGDMGNKAARRWARVRRTRAREARRFKH